MTDGGSPGQPHPGTRINDYRCSLPGLAGFIVRRCEGTGRGHRDTAPEMERGIMLEPLPTRQHGFSPVPSRARDPDPIRLPRLTRHFSHEKNAARSRRQAAGAPS